MKRYLHLNLFLLLCIDAYAQPGMWSWMNGDSTISSAGNFGIQGVAAPTNQPPALYEPLEFKDLQGNFWVFGGAKNSNQIYGDLWKYDPSINQWTWVKGTGLANSNGNYGIQGVPALNNLPPASAWGAPSWVDLNGDFWIYGGYDLQNGLMSDLWKYNVATNMWTWVHGGSGPGQPALYGTLGIPASNNSPGKRYECNVTFVDSSNNLWLFGGSDGNGHMNDLWKYDQTTNQWCWMKGANFLDQLGVYGVKGIPNSTNVPGARSAYCHWKDSIGNFWFFGGVEPPIGSFNDMWMYSTSTNTWTWMSGSDIPNNNSSYGTQCIPSVSNFPSGRFENRCFWTDSNGNFWLYGGGSENTLLTAYSDLWMFNPLTLEWSYVSGDTLSNQNPVYGALGIPSVLNKPGSRVGNIGWFDSINNSLFLFGGSVVNWPAPINDLWRYEIDPNCPQIAGTIPVVNLASSDTSFCEKYCLNFFDLSTNNPTSWQWVFPGSDSLTSTLQNPTNICYSNYGSYDVTLIACNAAGCDTLHFTNFISCYQNPVDSIYQSNDTLFSLPSYSYQWYEVTNGIVAGATNQYFVPQQQGSYYCIITDSIGCSGSSGTITITGSNQISNLKSQILIIPNPFKAILVITIPNQNINVTSLTIKNVLGQNVWQHFNSISDIRIPFSIDLSFLTDGIYFLTVATNETLLVKKVVKQ